MDDVVHVLVAEVEKSTDPILGISCVIVATPAVVNVAVSWASGTLTDQVAVDHVVPACQFVVTGEVNVIQVFPPQSPELPVIADRFHEPAHAPIISWISTLEQTTDDAVSLKGAHLVPELTNNRFITELPASVRVPVIVWSALIVRVSVFVAVHVLDKVANVLFHEIVCDVQLNWAS